MTEKGYLACIDFFSRRPRLKKAAVILQKLFEALMYAVYPLFILWLILGSNELWWKSLLVCGSGFIAVTLIRLRINAVRPYEKYGIEPLIKKDKKGQSFPSRHAFSAAVIAVNVGVYCLPLGILLGFIALAIAFLRVVLGVHFIRDVAFGIITGVAVGLIVLI